MNRRKHGDLNTKYFHLIAKIRKSRGKFLTLKGDNDEWITDDGALKQLAVSFFKQIFQTTHFQSCGVPSLQIPRIISSDEVISLCRPITEEEVKYNLFQMDLIKSPGPDGIQHVFYHKYWSDIKSTLVNFCLNCFESATIPEENK